MATRLWTAAGTLYLTVEKTHSATNSKFSKKLDHESNVIYEVELAKAQIEHKELIIVELLLLQYDFLCLALAKNAHQSCIRSEMKEEL